MVNSLTSGCLPLQRIGDPGYLAQKHHWYANCFFIAGKEGAEANKNVLVAIGEDSSAKRAPVVWWHPVHHLLHTRIRTEIC